MTGSPATAPNSGVSLEVGATYRIPSGREVRLLDATPDRLGWVPCYDPASNDHQILQATSLVRVVPTPGDRWLVFGADGEPVLRTFEEESVATAYAERIGGVVAKFAFVEYVGEQSDG